MPGPRVFAVEEVDALIPDLRLIFDELDALRSRIKTVHLRINALELIWGDAVHQPENPDHEELAHHLEQMRALQAEFEETSKRVACLGGQIKAVEPPLVDFFGVRDGTLVHWCWTGGEDRVSHWHHIDEGFTGRQPL